MTAVALPATVLLVNPDVAATLSTFGVETACDASSGNSFINDAKTVLFFRNSDSGSHTITFNVKQPGPDGTFIKPVLSTIAFTLPAGDSACIGPFNHDMFDTVAATRTDAQGDVLHDAQLCVFKASDSSIKVVAVESGDPFLSR